MANRSVDIHCNRAGIVQIAQPASDSEGFNLAVLDAIPTSIPIHTENPQDEPLYKESLLVTSIYDDLSMNSDGLGVSGTSGTDVRFQPEVVQLASVSYEGERLVSLRYRRNNGQTQTLSVEEVLARADDGELAPPFKIFQEPQDASFRIPEGRLACVCLKPIAIRQQDAIVEEIEFEGGLRIRVIRCDRAARCRCARRAWLSADPPARLQRLLQGEGRLLQGQQLRESAEDSRKTRESSFLPQAHTHWTRQRVSTVITF